LSPWFAESSTAPGHHRSRPTGAAERARLGSLLRPMTRWASLLAVQDHDTRLVQLARRLDTLPERSQLAATARQVAAVDARLAAADERRSDLSRGQQRLEDEIASLNERADRVDKQLYSGTVTNPRELLALQDDVASLRRRIGKLEDDELEIMMLSESVEAQRAELAAEHEQLESDMARLTGDLAATEGEITAELEAVRREREAAATEVRPELLAQYDALRSRHDGVAIARLVGATCQGCHLQLPAVEIARIRALGLDDVVHCDSCGRLLVRD
jgi:predicted  nucleic acid-binding Zn-ribbon protein